MSKKKPTPAPHLQRKALRPDSFSHPLPPLQKLDKRGLEEWARGAAFDGRDDGEILKFLKGEGVAREGGDAC